MQRKRLLNIPEPTFLLRKGQLYTKSDLCHLLLGRRVCKGFRLIPESWFSKKSGAFLSISSCHMLISSSTFTSFPFSVNRELLHCKNRPQSFKDVVCFRLNLGVCNPGSTNTQRGGMKPCNSTQKLCVMTTISLGRVHTESFTSQGGLAPLSQNMGSHQRPGPHETRHVLFSYSKLEVILEA